MDFLFYICLYQSFKTNQAMKIGTKQYFNNVKKEIINLRNHATKEELNRLDFNELDGLNGTKCIYGQMAKHCHTDRALELIKKCCKTKTSFESLSDDETQSVIPRSESEFSFSYLEHFICNYLDHNEMVIKYLKGESDELNFEQIEKRKHRWYHN
jgi:hypothetical protein